MSRVAFEEFVDRAAFELVDMDPPDQGAALAAACETLAEYLSVSRPDLTEDDIRAACVSLAKRVRARLGEIEAQGVGQTVH